MSKTDTQSEALTPQLHLRFAATQHLALCKKFGPEGFKLDLPQDGVQEIINLLDRAECLDAENKALRERLEQESAIRQHGWSIHYADERDFCLAASPLIGAAYTVGADAVRRLNNSAFGPRHFGKVRATGPSQSDTPQAAAKNGDAA